MMAGDVAKVLDDFSPKKYACEWDNVGMHTGSYSNQVSRILVTLDIDENAIETALDKNVHMIVSHHPLLFHGIKQINEDSFMGRRILTLIKNNINAFCMHTNFDCTHMGFEAAKRMKLNDVQVLEELADKVGIGVVGTLNKEYLLKDFGTLVKDTFGLETLTCYGQKDAAVNKIAIVPGSGKDYIEMSKEKGAQLILTGDITYHYGIDGAASGINIIDAGHYGLEKIFLDVVAEHLKEKIPGIEIFKNTKTNVFYG